MRTRAIDPLALQPRDVYRLLTSLVVPRPIAWVSTVAPSGARNLAPHSYFNICSQDPPILHFTQGSVKDSVRNAEATGEFVISLVSREMLEQMNISAADFPADQDEFEWAGVEAAPSTLVAPPRVAEAPASFECRVREVIRMGNGHMVFGDVVHIHVAESAMIGERIDPLKLHSVGRLGGPFYTFVEQIHELARPTWEQLRNERTPR